MTDHDNLLYRSQPHKLGWYTSSDLKALVTDLRAALATQPELADSPWGWSDDDELLYTHTDGDTCVTAVSCPSVREALHAALAVAGSATPTTENDDE
jgi:hypothetical protein